VLGCNHAREGCKASRTLRPDHAAKSKIGSLVKGPDRYVLDTPADAKGYEARLTEALKTLKGFLQANESKAESKSFEL